MAAQKGFSKILILIIGLLVGFQIGKWLTSSSTGTFDKVEQVLKITEQYYLQEIDPDTLSETAIEGIFSKLDPHTTYIPADIQAVIEEEFEGSFEGIGIEFQIIDDTITVVSPIIGGPSEELGIQPGDKIIEIEDTSAIGFKNTDVVRMLRGEKGSEVNITVYRPTVNDKIDYTIVRDVIPINSVETSFIVQDSVGYVRLSRFAEKTTDELKTALSDLSDQGMEYLVLDLRNNPGGYLDQSVTISDLFIDGEKLIVFTDGRVPDFDEEFKAGEESEYENIPLIILINRGSASASEIVSGAVQDWDRGLVIGETSFGKGLVQRSFMLSDNSAIRLTISEYFTPSGRAIQRPYSDKKSYYDEIINRGRDSSVFKHDTTDISEPAYETVKGRKLYSKGGIEPDYFVQTFDLTNFTASVRSKNLFFQFIRSQFDDREIVIPESIKNNLSEFSSYDIIDDKVIEKFKKYLESKNVEINETEFLDDINYIKILLKAYIARDIFNSRGWYFTLLNEDEPFQTSIQKLKEAKEMLNNYK